MKITVQIKAHIAHTCIHTHTYTPHVHFHSFPIYVQSSTNKPVISSDTDFLFTLAVNISHVGWHNNCILPHIHFHSIQCNCMYRVAPINQELDLIVPDTSFHYLHWV